MWDRGEKIGAELWVRGEKIGMESCGIEERK